MTIRNLDRLLQPLLAFLSGVMRSICDDHWGRARRDLELLVQWDDYGDLAAPEARAADLPPPMSSSTSTFLFWMS